jgi:N-acetylglucosaminyl-diphospho-decaprenol L-rhamnosyltransferase
VEVLVAVVTYNSSHVVGGLLESLPEALSGVSHYVVVVDNGSEDDTVKRLEGAVDRLVRGSNVGYAAAINRAVDAALADGLRPEAVLVLNPDVVLAPGSVRSMLVELRRSGAGIVTPLVREADGRVSTSLRRDPSLGRALGLGRTGHPALSEWVTEPDAYARPHDTDWAVGAVLLVSMACHEDVGGWDPGFFLYSEETDLCLRARDLGWRTRYAPEAEAMHIGGASGESARTHTMQVVNRVRLYRRRHGASAATAYFALTCLGELSWLARGQRRSGTALAALLLPGRRPPEIAASDRLIPT